MSLAPAASSVLRDCRAGRADAGHDDAHVRELLADDAERVDQRGEDDDRRAVLVVVEDRDVERLAESALDLEAARSRDVLEVDPAEHGGDRHHRAHDLVDVLRRQADRPRVDTAELLEQDGLALHHRQRSFGADVAEPEHGRAVADDGDGVLLDRQRPDLRGIRGDRGRDTCDAGRVGDREVVARLERRSRRHLELAAEVGEERAVGDVLDLDSIHLPYGFEDPLDVRGVSREERHVAHLVPAPDSHEVDRAEEAACVADRLGESRERARVVLEAHAHRGAERRRGVHCGVPVADHVRVQCDIVPGGLPILSNPTCPRSTCAKAWDTNG